MLARFFPPESKPVPQNRFTKIPKSEMIFNYLLQLQNKKEELKESAGDQKDSIDFFKFKILNNLIDELNAKMDAFNKSPALSNEAGEEDRACFNLLNELYKSTDRVRLIHEEILNKPRNSHLKLTRNACELAIVGGVLVSGSIAAVPIALGAVIMTDNSKYFRTTATSQLINNFLKELESAIRCFNFNILVHDMGRPTTSPR